MIDEELIQFIIKGREERNLEYKGPIKWIDAQVKARITKTILAMSNLKDGGAIVVGVEQQGERFIPVGLDNKTLATFKQDEISAYVNEYADPFVEIKVSHIEYLKMKFVVIQINEFLELPVICKKDGIDNLRKGAVYIRPRRKIETVEVPGQVEMREILENATEKLIRKFRSQLLIAEPYTIEPENQAKEKFDNELQGYDMEEILNKIHSTEYWGINIRPIKFEDEIIKTLTDARELIDKCGVLLRGWDYPHFTHADIKNGNNWIESHVEFEGHIEYWRLYQSGQFIHDFACVEDYEVHPDEISNHSTRLLSPSGRYLSI
ncbi:MAG: ATP-binding protein, partial [bacterium]|nr:ATP-binding protein [bacterium]